MKIFVFVLLLAIIVSLASGLFFLARDDQGSTRVLTAMKVRVALSAILIGFLVFAYFQGWIVPRSG